MPINSINSGSDENIFSEVAAFISQTGEGATMDPCANDPQNRGASLTIAVNEASFNNLPLPHTTEYSSSHSVTLVCSKISTVIAFATCLQIFFNFIKKSCNSTKGHTLEIGGISITHAVTLIFQVSDSSSYDSEHSQQVCLYHECFLLLLF